MSADMVPAEPVFDGELVDEQTEAYQTPPSRRFTAWWQRSRLVPPSLKSRQAATYAVKVGFAWTVRSPLLFLGSVCRGVVVAVRGWRRWVRVHDYREAAEQSEKLADKFVEIRALTLFRWKVTGVVVVGAVVAGAVLDLLW